MGWVRPSPAVADAWRHNACLVQEDLLAEKQPSMQFASPEDIGGAVNYFCSQAAQQVTGTTLTVDGGWTAQ